MTALALLASTFGLVFALGLQSLNVNGGHMRLAFLTSFAIGAAVAWVACEPRPAALEARG